MLSLVTGRLSNNTIVHFPGSADLIGQIVPVKLEECHGFLLHGAQGGRNKMKQTKSFEIDMCNGTLMDKLISFSIPLMLSGILQLMFNAVDIIVVGRFAGSESLAAVGSTTALINVFTNLFIGISLGSNVLAARYYAAGKEREMSETVHSSLTLALISGILMAFAGLFFSRTALEWMGTPDDVIDLAALYENLFYRHAFFHAL